MSKEEVKRTYHTRKKNILANKRLSQVEKDIAGYKNWCIYVQGYVNSASESSISINK